MNSEFAPLVASEEKGWSNKRKVTIGAVLAGIMVVAVVVAGTANKNDHAAVLQRQAIEDSHPMYAGLQISDIDKDLSLAPDDYPDVWGKIRADATGDGFKELVMCGNTFGAHFFWNQWNGGAATLRNAAQHNLIYVRMYDKRGHRVQTRTTLSAGNVWWNARHNVWLNDSPWNNNVGAAKGWVHRNWHGDAWMRERMWWSCPTNRHRNLGAGRIYWACGHGGSGGGGLHIDKLAHNCIWQWQNRVKKDNLDQVFVFYKVANCRP